MIDSFPFESWYLPDGSAFNPDLGSYWAFVGAESGPAYGDTSASSGTWVLTVIGMVTVLLAFIGWFAYERRRLQEATERIRAVGRWHGRVQMPEHQPPAGPGISES
jgi:hypothetical protein